MKEIIIQLLTAFLGALGFALLFGTRGKHLFFAALGGLLTWGVYLAVHHFLPSLFFSNLIASVFAVTAAELFAHWRKCPSTVFLIPSIVPLAPGSSLYYAMSYAVQRDIGMAEHYGHQLLITAIAIAAGVSFVTVCRELHGGQRKKEESPKNTMDR